METIHSILEIIGESDDSGVLATIIHVTGSAYRREGTCMLFLEDGRQAGILTAGCLESDLAARAEELFVGGPSQLLVYDMRVEDDLSWGRGAGCNGEIHIFLENVDMKMREHLRAVKRNLDLGVSMSVIKIIEGAFIGDYLFITDTDGPNQMFGKWRGRTGESMLRQVGEIRQNGIQASTGWYVQHFKPKPRLFLFGAGADARPLSDLASRTGFSVVVSDWRRNYVEHDFFAEADEILIGYPHEILPRLSFRPEDCVVIMTHNFELDRELLKHLKTIPLLYLGVLGPRARTSRLLEEESLSERIRSPVGINIGAEGPEEIAVSIVSDLIRHLRCHVP